MEGLTLIRSLTVMAAAALLASCAHVKYADGQRVAIEHDNYQNAQNKAELQAAADQACLASGGKAPAKMLSNLPLHDGAPSWMLRHTATFACAQ